MPSYKQVIVREGTLIGLAIKMILMHALHNLNYYKFHTQDSNIHGTMENLEITQFKRNLTGYLATLVYFQRGLQHMQISNLEQFQITVQWYYNFRTTTVLGDLLSNS
jgi:hypothetical protein